MARPWNKKHTIMLEAAAFLAVLVLIARPWDCFTQYRCIYCQARVTRHWIFAFQLPGAVREGELTHYWMREVDPEHKHVMQPSYSHNANGVSADHLDYFFEGWAMIREDRAIAILKSLPTPKARQAFVKKRLLQIEQDYQFGEWQNLKKHARPAS